MKWIVGTVNVGSMTGRCKEIADLMESGGLGYCVYRILDGRGIRRKRSEERVSLSTVERIGRGEIE